jgi:hypothetical protein
MKLISENVLSYLRYYLVKPGNPPFLGVRSPLSPVSVNYIDPLLFFRKRRSYPRSTKKSRSKKRKVESGKKTTSRRRKHPRLECLLEKGFLLLK